MDSSAQSTLDEARAAGIDLDMIDSNLALSVKARWEQHESAVALAVKLQDAGKVRNAKLQPTVGTTE